jgi:hypothetical protein
MNNPLNISRAGFCFIILALGLSAYAGPVMQTGNMKNLPSPGETWETGELWSDGLPAGPGKDYVNNGLRWVTRTPVGSMTFPGNSLTISNGARIALRTNPGEVLTIHNLIVEAGCRVLRGTPRRASLAGNIKLIGKGSVTFDAQTDERVTTISALLTAEPSLQSIVLDVIQERPTSAVNTAGFIFTNPANTFTGLWDVQAGMLKGQGLGKASFLVDNFGFLDFDSDYVNPEGSLTIIGGGKLLIDQNLTFRSVTITRTLLAPGEYTGAYLKATFGSTIAAGSRDDATITVLR